MRKLTLDEFVERSKSKHGDKYNYSCVNYINFQTKVEIVCPIHGSFFQTPNNHMSKGCIKCKCTKIKNTKLKRYGTENFNNIEKIKTTNFERYASKSPLSNADVIIKSHATKLAKHGNSNFNNSEKAKATNLCRYGVDNASKRNDIKDILRIAALSRSRSMINKASDSRIKKIKDELISYIGPKYELISYDGYYDIKIRNIENDTTITTSYYTIKRRKENNKDLTNETQTSYMQNDIIEFIKGLGYTFEVNTRKIISPLELDIFIPSKNIAIEFNGLYWHSEENKPNDYHLKKTEECEAKGIHLIHIYEDNWLERPEIIKSRLKSILGVSSEKIFARKCTIMEIDNKTTKSFLEMNHIQGCGNNAKYRYGLMYNDEPVAVMTFGPGRFEKATIELLRFANKLHSNVIGGASRLFKYFLNTINPTEVISYADRSWSQGKLYETLGFELVSKTKPNYSYVINRRREGRFKHRKSELIKLGFDSAKTEVEIMSERGYFRIFDSGSLKYKYLC